MSLTMTQDSARRLLIVGSSASQIAAVEPALAGLACAVSKAHDYHAIGAALAAGVDILVFCGAPAGLSAKRLLPSIVDRANPMEVLIAMPDAAEAEALAQISGGRAVPFPPPAAVFEAGALLPAAPREMRVRTHSRWRLYSAAELSSAGAVYPALVLNVSRGGAMILSNVEVDPGALVSVTVDHGGERYAFAGHVRHTYLNMPVPPETLETAPLLKASDPLLFGIEFIEHSRSPAERLCAVLAETPLSVSFDVLCVPGVPKGLSPVLEAHGVTIQVAGSLKAEGAGVPDVLIADIATCALDEIPILRRLAKQTVLIGVATRPIVEPERTGLAALLPAVFVLPFQGDTLIEAVERFFRPIHRRFPRIEFPFGALVRTADGRNLAGDGVNLSLNGIAVDLDVELPRGAAVQGTLSAENAAGAVGFEGTIVYVRAEGGRFRTGIHIEVEKKAISGYVGFLSTLLHREMQIRWRRQNAPAKQR